MKYQVLLYYYYTDIEDPEAFSEEHLDLCKGMNLKGRILVANERYKRHRSGTVEDTESIWNT